MMNVTSSSPEEEYLTEGMSNDTLWIVTLAFCVVLIPTVSMFGLIGNILSLVVLVNRRMRSSTNSCLAALAFSDILVLIHSLMFACTFIISVWDPIQGRNFRNTIYPLFGSYGSIVTARITSLLTTMLCIERFIAVYKPIKAKQLCCKRHAHMGIAFIYIVTVLLFIPFACKYHSVTQFSSRTNRTLVLVFKTDFGNNETFHRVYGNILNILFRIVPLIVILVLNTLIAWAIRKTGIKRKQLSESYPPKGRREQSRITLMLLAVSFVFLICIIPGAVSSFVSKINSDYSRFGRSKNLYLSVSYMAFFLETLNSSINFIIYMAFSQKFWRTCKEIFCFQTAAVKARELTHGSNVNHNHLFAKRHQSLSSLVSNPDTKITRLGTSVCSNESVNKRNKCTRIQPESRFIRLSFDSENINIQTLCAGVQHLHYEPVPTLY